MDVLVDVTSFLTFKWFFHWNIHKHKKGFTKETHSYLCYLFLQWKLVRGSIKSLTAWNVGRVRGY